MGGPPVRFRLVDSTIVIVMLAVLAASGGASAAQKATLRAVTSTTLGTTILVDARGFTVYRETSEKKHRIACTGACRKTWPPLLAGKAKPLAGAGVKAGKLGTIRRPDGGVQVTYGGFALYRYQGDRRAGQANGQGAGGVWYAVTPAGAVTRAAVHTSSPGSGSVTTAAGSTAPASGSGGSGTTTVDSEGCPPGQTIAQGVANGNDPTSDDDDDNEGGPDDGDGCI
jgi:predicted lipoprotein with Yx(FWY)xxD motif